MLTVVLTVVLTVLWVVVYSSLSVLNTRTFHKTQEQKRNHNFVKFCCVLDQ